MKKKLYNAPCDNLNPWMLLPAKPGVCSQCAVDHRPEQPHNQQSVYYQYWFFNQFGRWPTWDDAMAHCDDAIREFWRHELRQRGVKI